MSSEAADLGLAHPRFLLKLCPRHRLICVPVKPLHNVFGSLSLCSFELDGGRTHRSRINVLAPKKVKRQHAIYLNIYKGPMLQV